MLTSARFGSTAARARFLGHRLCEAQRVALLLAEHDCFAPGSRPRLKMFFFFAWYSCRASTATLLRVQRLVPVLIGFGLNFGALPVHTTSCDQSRMALFPLLRAAHKQVIGCLEAGTR